MRRTVAVPLLALLVMPFAASGQQLFFYHLPDGDSASVLLTGDTGSVQVRVSTCAGVSAYQVRIFFDPSRLSVVDADSVPGYGLPKPTLTSGTGYVDLAAGGTGSSSCTTRIADLRLQLAGGALDGAFLSARILSLTDFIAVPLPDAEVNFGQVCQAEVMWADADSSRTVTSRDALVFLSAAVGLATPGFDLTVGDVDDDGQVTTRDALLTLTRALGISALRAGEPRVNRCAPATGTPVDLAMHGAGGVYRLAAGDTLPMLLGFNPTGGYRFAWAPDGSRILITQTVSGFNQDLIAIYTDLSGADTLGVGTGHDMLPAWSPDGSRIAFASQRVSPRALFVMDADGQNQIQLTDSLWVYDVDWRPDGSEIIVSAYHQESCCARRLYAVAPDGSSYREVFPNSNAFEPYSPSVSPAGDSIVFQHGLDGGLFAVAITGDTAAVRASQVFNSHNNPAWVNAGFVFSAPILYPYRMLWQHPDGRVNVVSTGTTTQWSDVRAWEPGVWVETVDLAQDSIEMTGTTAQLTVTVTNSDATVNGSAPVRWVSRDPSLVTVDQTGLVTAQGSSGLTWVVASTGGWRSDSTRIYAPGFVPPPASPVRRDE